MSKILGTIQMKGRGLVRHNIFTKTYRNVNHGTGKTNSCFTVEVLKDRVLLKYFEENV